MANPLPVVYVRRLSDVEGLTTHAGPRRIILEQAESISKVCAMVSVFRAKGLLRKGHGNVFRNDDIDSADEGSGADDEDLGLGEGGWAAEQEKDPDLGLILARVASVSDDVGSDHEGGVAKDAHQDVVADGWVVDNLFAFRCAVHLGMVLEEVAGDILPLLVRNPADSAAIRRLRTRARAIRDVGKKLPSLMGQGPVTLGNHLKNIADKALRPGAGGAAWMASRCNKLLGRVLALYQDHQVDFDSA